MSRHTPPAPLRDERERAFAALHWIVPLLTAMTLAIPLLEHPFWHDEMYTEIHFANHPRAALTQYYIPNNHVLFSLQWWAFRHLVDDPGLWRLLPYGFFLIATVFMYLAGARFIRSRFGGFLVAMIFATLHPVLAFATELRGYSPSMTYVAVALYALARWRDDTRRRWMVLYGLMAFCAVMTVPVNLAAFAPMALWVGWTVYRARRTDRPAVDTPASARKRERRGWGTAVYCALIPFTGLAFLIPVRDQLQKSIAAGSSMAKTTFLVHYPIATLGDFFWLPLAAWLLWRMFRPRPSTSKSASARTGADAASAPVPLDTEGFGVLALAVLTPMACALILPRTPNDYTLIAVVPMIALGFGWVSAPPLEALRRRLRPRLRAVGTVAFTVLLIAAAIRREQQDAAWSGGKRTPDIMPFVDVHGVDVGGYNLYRQRFQYNTSPVEVVDAVAALIREAGDLEAKAVVFVERGDFLTLLMYWQWRHMDAMPNVHWLVTPFITRDIPASEAARVLWRDYPRRFFVVSEEPYPTGLTTDKLPLMPDDWIVRRFYTWEFNLFEWMPESEARAWAKENPGGHARALTTPPAARLGW